MRVALKMMLVFSVKTSSSSVNFDMSTLMAPVWRQATEKFDGSSLRPSGWPHPPFRACEMWQVTPGTLGSSKSATHTLSLGERKLNVVLMQLSSSARAKAGIAKRNTVAIKHKSHFRSPFSRRLQKATLWIGRKFLSPLAAGSREPSVTTGLRDVSQSIRPALDFTDRGSMIFHYLPKPGSTFADHARAQASAVLPPMRNSTPIVSSPTAPRRSKKTATFRATHPVRPDRDMSLPACLPTNRAPAPQWPTVPHKQHPARP